MNNHRPQFLRLFIVFYQARPPPGFNLLIFMKHTMMYMCSVLGLACEPCITMLLPRLVRLFESLLFGLVLVKLE